MRVICIPSFQFDCILPVITAIAASFQILRAFVITLAEMLFLFSYDFNYLVLPLAEAVFIFFLIMCMMVFGTIPIVTAS